MIRILKWISKSFRNRTKSVDGSFDRYESSYPRVYESRLEDRRVLNAAAVIGVADLGSLRFDAGSQANDGGMDTFELSRISTSQDGKEIAVTINDRKVWQGSASQIGAIRFEGSSDMDQFLIDPSIQVGTGIFIDGGQFPLGSHDRLVLATASDRDFQEIVYHSNEHSVQLRFLESSSQPASTLHVQNVGDIDDRSVALNRHFDFSSTNSAWQLSGSAAAEGSVTTSSSLYLSNSEIGFRFESPSSNLTFDYGSTNSGESTFVLKDIQLNELDRFEWLGRDSDTFLASGKIELGRSLFVQSGSIQMDGSMYGNHSSIVLDANRMLNISSAAAIRDEGGTFTATSPALFHSGLVDMGATGVITMNAGEGVLNIDGLLQSRGDDEHSGGSIFLLGDKVSVLNHSIVDVSGGKGGGQILVGGDERGSNPLIRNATHTTIALHAVLNADARVLGNGGKIVVWANDTAVVDGSGNIRARGGALGGNGGWIETSGKRMLFVNDAANASAVNGHAGTWLIDPLNIEVVTAAPGSPAADTSYILVGTLNTALGLGTNTTLDTTVLPGAAVGSITINAAIIAAPDASTTLSLNANNNILFKAGVTGNAGTSNLSLKVSAGNNVDASSVTLGQLQSLSIIATGDVSLSTVTAGGTGQLISVKSGASKSIHLNGNLQTNGASVSLSGGKLLVDGTAARQITTGTNAVVGGTVDLSGITTIDGEGNVASLEIDTRGTSTAGSVSLGNVIASGKGLNQVLIKTNSTTAGQVTLGDVMLVTKGALAPSLVVQSGGTKILANGTINLSTSGSGQTGGSVDFGASQVAPVDASSTLTIQTGNSSATGGDGGTVILGGVSANGTAYFDRITIDTSATNTSATDGAINLANVANPSFTVDGASGTGVTLIGRILSFFGGTLSLFTKPVSIGQDSSAIDLTKADFQTKGGLVFDTSDGNQSKVAGNVLLGDLGVSVQPSSLLVDTRGTTSSGSLILNDGVAGITELHVAGDLDLTKTTTQLSDDVSLNVNADGSALGLGKVTSSNARNLKLTSRSDVSVGQMDLTGGTLAVTVDSNGNEAGATFQSNGTISAGSVSISGTGANDNVAIGNNLTTTVGSIDFSNLDTVTLKGSLSSKTTVDVSGTVKDLLLGGGADIVSVGSIGLTSVVNGLSLVGASGTSSTIQATGVASKIAISNVSSSNARSLTLISNSSISTGQIDLTGGTLTATIDSNDDETGATFQPNGSISAGAVFISGRGANDDVTIDSGLTTTVGSIVFSNLDTVTLNTSISSKTTVGTTGTVKNLLLNGGADINAVGSIDLSTVTNGLSLTGASGTNSTIQATGVASNITLGKVTSSNARNLKLISNSNISIGQTDLSGGALSATIDSNGDQAGATFQSSGIISAGSVLISGIGSDDNATIGNSLTTTASSVTFSNLDSVTLNGSLSSKTTVGVSDTVNNLLLNGGADIVSFGSIDLSTVTNGLSLTGASGTSSTIQATGLSSNIRLGKVTSSNARNLTLTSNSNISTGQMSLAGGALTATIDSNGNETGALFQSSGTISAGSVSIRGTGANDNASIGNNLTTTVGSIAFSNLDMVKLNGDVSAKTKFGTTGTVNDLLLESGADIDAVETIDLTSVTNGLSLVGANGTTNKLTATGATSNVTPGKVTVTNNVSLSVSSGYKATIEDIDLKGGTLDVSFGQSTNLTDASAQFQKVTAGGLVVTGKSRVNDQVQLNAAIVVGSNGILIQNYNDLDINAAIRSDGNVQFAGINTSKIHMGADVATKGGNVKMSGGTLLVDGTVDRKIITGAGSVATGGSVSLSGLNSIDGETSVASLEIDTRGTTTAGSVSLGSVIASGKGLSKVLIETNSTTAGQVILGDVRLVTDGALAPKLVVQSGGTKILANGTINLSTSGSGQTGGSVDFGASQVAPVDASSTLTIQTGNSSATGGDGGTVILGGVSANGTAYFDRITIDTSATNTSATDGAINLANVANPSFTVDGASGTGVTLIGRILSFFGGTLSLFTKPVSIGQDSSAIDLTKADFQTKGGLVFDTSDGNQSKVAGNVLLGDLGVSVQPSSLLVDTRGTTSSGSLVLNDGVAGITELHVAGNLDLTKTTTQLSDDVLLDVNADGSTLGLGNVTSNSARNLKLTSRSNVSVGQVDLTGGTLAVAVDLNGNETGATFQSNGTISAGSVSISGTGANDNVAIGNNLTTTVGSIDFSNLDTVTLKGSLSSKTTIDVSGTVKDLLLGGGADIVSVGSIDLTSVVNGLSLVGAGGSSSTIQATGVASTIAIGNVSSSNARSLTLISNSSISTGAIDLTGGTLTATIDSNDNETGATFKPNGSISAGAVLISGRGANDDVTIDSGLTTTVGSIVFSNLDTVTLNTSISSKTTVGTTGTVKELLLSGGADINAVGSIDLSKVTNGLSLTGASGTNSTIQATGVASNITLGKVTSSNARNLTLTSSSNISIGQTDLIGGTLEATIDSNGDEAKATFLSSGTISAGTVSIGGTESNDNVTIGNSLTTTAGSVKFSNLDLVTLNGSLSSKTTVGLSGTVNDLRLGGGADIVSVGSIDLSTVTKGLSLTGPSGTSSTIQATGLSSDITLGNVTSSNVRNLTLTSNSHISTGQMSLAGGALTATIDSNGNETGALFKSSGTISAGSVSIRGTGANDNGSIDSNLTTTVGSIVFSDLGTVTLNGDVSAKTTFGTMGIVNDMQLVGGRNIVSVGSIDLTSVTKGLSLTGASGTSSTIQATGVSSNIALGKVTSGNARNLTLTSNSNISIGQMDLTGGSLTATIDSNGDEVGATFQSNGSISVGSVFISGTNANDNATIGSGLTTTVGSIVFSNLDRVTLKGSLSSKGTVGTSGTVKDLLLDGGANLDSVDSIDLTSITNGLTLTGASGTGSAIRATGVASNITLGSVTSSNARNLTLSSNSNILVGQMNLAGGIFVAILDSNGDETGATFQMSGSISAGSVLFRGTNANDNVTIGNSLTTTVGSIAFSNLDTVILDANLTSAATVSTNGTVKDLLLSGGADIDAVGTIDLTSLTNGLNLTGVSGASNTIQTTGVASNIAIGKVTSINARNLTLNSNSSVSSGQMSLNGGTLIASIDSNGDESGATFQSNGSISAGVVLISGTGANDNAIIGNSLTTTVGSIVFSNLDIVTLNDDVSSKTTMSTSGTVNVLLLGGGADIVSVGSIDLTSVTNGLRLTGGSGTSSSIQVTGDESSLALGNLTASNSASLSLVSGYKLTTGDTDVGSGILKAVFGVSTNQTDAKAQFQQITADRLVISGNSRVNDRVELNGAVAIGSGGIQIANYNELDINATVRSDGSVIFVGGGLTVDADVISTFGAVTIASSGGIAGNGAVAGTAVELTSQLDIGNGFAFKTRTGSLTAQSVFGRINVSNSFADMTTVSSLKTVQGGPINIRQTGGGALSIQTIQTGESSLNGPSNIGVINDSGLIAVDGKVSAGGQGSISLNASGDVILGSSARLETSGESATIQSVAGGQFQFLSGAIVSAGSSDPKTQAVLSKIPTPVNVSPIADAFGVSVTADGVTTVAIRLGDTNPVIVDQNLAVKIFWGPDDVDDFTTGTLSSTTTNPNIARFDATGVPVLITHRYSSNPNLTDPTASIPIKVEVGVDAKGRIQLSDSQGLDTRINQVIPAELRVPTLGLVSLRFDLPQAPSASRPLVFDRILVTQSTANTEVSPKLQVIESTSAETSADGERKYVLRLVTPLDEFGRVSESKDVELTLNDIEDLNALFKRLPDNRYRIYMIMDSGNSLRLQDFLLRNHLPVEIEDRIKAETKREPEQNANEGSSDSNAKDSDRAETAIDAGAPVSLLDPALPQTSDEDSSDTNRSNVISSVAAVSGSLLGANNISLRKAARRFRSQ
jgi:hypothetical protein